MLFCTTQNLSSLLNCNRTYFDNLDMVTPLSKQEATKEDMFQLKMEKLPYIVNDSEFRKFSFKINITFPLFLFDVCATIKMEIPSIPSNETGNTTNTTVEWYNRCNWSDCSHGMYLGSKWWTFPKC